MKITRKKLVAAMTRWNNGDTPPTYSTESKYTNKGWKRKGSRTQAEETVDYLLALVR